MKREDIMKEEKIKKKIFIGLSILLILIISFISYDRVTVKKEYYIGEKNINIPIFVYHNIVQDETEVKYDYMQTTDEIFEEQIKGLQKMGYHFISYEDLVEYKNGNKKLFKKSCIITFDDGCEGVYKNAYPIAKKYNIPFTIFIIINNMNTNGAITWEQAKEMQESNLVTIASHSVDHAEFNKLSTEEAVNNVKQSYKIIEEKLQKEKIKIFTYPYGLYTEEQIQILEKEGYIQNLTDNKINNSKNLDLYSLHRCYPLSDSIYKIILKIYYRSIRYS